MNNISLNSQNQSKRNGLIELYRFLFAVNVVKGHGLFILDSPYFGPARISVEFFFILSGFLFASYLEKNKSLPFKKDLIKLLRSKLGPVMIPLVVGIGFNIISTIVMYNGEIKVWGYLWYVKDMMLACIFYVVLRKCIKSDKVFLLVTAGICLVATILKFFGPFYTWGYFRAASTLSLGILIGRIPKLQLKKKWPIWIMLVPVITACFTVVCFGLGDVLWGEVKVIEIILDVVLYPALVYLTFQLDVKSRWMNYLGALSFGLYAFQCPADFLRNLGIGNRFVWFTFILVASITEERIKKYRFRKHHHSPVTK